MKKLLIVLSVVMMMALSANQAQAQTSFILDTGVIPNSPTVSLGHISGTSDPQFLAVNFSLDSSWDISGVAGWLAPNNWSDTYNLTFSIYADNAGLPPVPNTTPALFSGDLLFDSDYVLPYFYENGGFYGWHGLSDLDWNLSLGSYWLVLETLDDSEFSGVMSIGAPNDGPNAAEGYAYWFSSNNWARYDTLNLGFQIQGNPSSAVPEPATMLLFGTGLVGFAVRRRRKV